MRGRAVQRYREARVGPGFSDVTGRDLYCSYHSSTGGEGELTAGWRGERGARTVGKQLGD